MSYWRDQASSRLLRGFENSIQGLGLRASKEESERIHQCINHSPGEFPFYILKYGGPGNWFCETWGSRLRAASMHLCAKIAKTPSLVERARVQNDPPQVHLRPLFGSLQVKQSCSVIIIAAKVFPENVGFQGQTCH